MKWQKLISNDRLRTEINAGYGDQGFSFNGSGLISDNPQFQGWLGRSNWVSDGIL